MGFSKEEIWKDVLEILKLDSTISPTVSRIVLSNNYIKPYWYKNSRFIISCEDYTLTILKNNNEIKSKISNALKLVTGNDIEVSFILEGDEKSADTIIYASEKLENIKTDVSQRSNIINKNSRNKISNFTFDSFIEGESNMFAKALSIQVSDNPKNNDSNPLYLWGNSGLGKTHLLYSIANRILDNFENINVLYTECSTFVEDFVKCSINKAGYEVFRNKYRNIDVLLIDDIQYLENKEGSQNEFFNIFNYLINEGKQIVISSDRAPKLLNDLDERLTSRFSSGVTVDIQPPNYETRKAIILNRLKNDNIILTEEFINYFCENFTSNIRTLIGAYNTFKSYNNLSNEDMSFDKFKSIMEQLISHNTNNTLSPDFIANKVCNYFSAHFEKVTVDKLKSQNRSREVIEPRNICIYFFIELLNMTYSEVGNYFGGRKHSTIINSYNVVKDKYINEAKMSQILKDLEKEFK